MEFQPAGIPVCAGWLVEIVALVLVLLAGARARKSVFVAAGALGIGALVVHIAYWFTVVNPWFLQVDSRDLVIDVMRMVAIVISAAAWTCVAIGVRRTLSPR
jgi:hypothetical protein